MNIDAANLPPTLPVPKPGETLLGLTRPNIYRKLAAGDIKAIKDGRRTLLVTASIIAYLESLPQAAFGKKAAISTNN